LATSTDWQLERSVGERYDRILVPTILGPFARALVDRANLRRGESVLDVGCGTGAAALYAATLVEDVGKVFAIDVNAGMLEVARSRSRERGLAIDWREDDACHLPFSDESIDSILCAQTLQFLKERSQALSEIHRVLKPGGRVAISAWCPLPENPYFRTLIDSVSRHVGPEIAVGLGTAFSLADPDEICGLLSAAHFRAVSPAVVELELELPELTGFVQAHISATPMAAGFGAAAPEARAMVVNEVAGSFADAQIPFRSHMVLAEA
jgi:ubiquinone/menaquinone biosynthesis C-methylase UbiE